MTLSMLMEHNSYFIESSFKSHVHLGFICLLLSLSKTFLAKIYWWENLITLLEENQQKKRIRVKKLKREDFLDKRSLFCVDTVEFEIFGEVILKSFHCFRWVMAFTHWE